MKHVLIFGTGKAYSNRKYFFEDNKEIIIVGFIDNNATLQGKEIDRIRVYSPENVLNVFFDAIVLLSNQYYEEQKEQLIGLGVSENKIWDFNELKMELAETDHYTNSIGVTKKDILIITNEFGIDGGSLATVYLADALKDSNRSIYIATYHITKEALEVTNKHEIQVIIYEYLPYMSKGFLKWIKCFGFVVVNTVPMMPSAIMTCKEGIPSFLWVHEGEEVLYQIACQRIDKKDIPVELKLLFVSVISLNLFKKYFPMYNSEIVPIALPDQTNNINIINDKFTISIITSNSVNKNPLLMMRALKRLSEATRRKIKINYYGLNDDMINNIKKLIDPIDDIETYGILSPQAIHESLDRTDCVVCTSLVECLPTTAIEGFMHRCIVVVPDTVGIVEYIEHGKNGYVYKVNNEESLAKCIEEMLGDKSKHKIIKNNARLIYEKYFQYSSLRKSFMTLLNQ